jgi:hypothetical protein
MSTQTKARRRNTPSDLGGSSRSDSLIVSTAEDHLRWAIAILQADLDALPQGSPPGHWITQTNKNKWVERWIGPMGKTKERAIKGDRLRDWHRGEAAEPARQRLQLRINLISNAIRG